MIVFILVTNIPTFVFIFIQCKPYQKSWNAKLPGRCWSTDVSTKVGLYNGVVSVVIDWILASLPIVFLWDMQVSRKAKIGVCVLMSMGFFTGVTAIVRTVITKRVIAAGKTADFSWISIDLRLWGELEILVGIIAACIPAVKPLYSKAASSLGSWSKGKGSGGYTDDSSKQHRFQVIGPPQVPQNTKASGSAKKWKNGGYGDGGAWLDSGTGMNTHSAHLDAKIGTAVSRDDDTELQRLNFVTQPMHGDRL